MPRIALRFLLALSLVLQGPLPVLAAAAMRAQADDCTQAMARGDATEKKAPCCIGDCAPAVCMQACVANFAAFLVPVVADWTASDRGGATLVQTDTRPSAGDESPPIRPPIV
ncbi:MAG: hypothetical protein JSS42_12860 [Proteobacteria bacterium]|uniref:hypothetical protein n=1 Tax=Rudaea sp. TaxID=2136325 RepID=UPI003220238B|nr:hypothetical protein [Pseudomonadota bacterium]